MAPFPLHRAAEEGDLERVRQLIEVGVSVDSRDDEGLTPLHRAAEQGRYEVATLLIDRGCDLDPKDRRGRAPLWLAAGRGRKDVVDLLIARGAQVDGPDISAWTLLHLASLEGWSDVVLHILETGEADPNAATWGGSTPLMLAAGRDVAALLIRAGADVNQRNAAKKTALHFAAFSGSPILVQVLLEQEGLELNPQDVYGRTPLHLACDLGCLESVKQLLEAGADHNIKNKKGQTALSMTIGRRSGPKPEIIRLLVQHGAFFEEFDFLCISRNPVLEENVLKDADLCTRSIVNKFHHQSLPALYRNPYLARNLPHRVNFKLSAREIDEVENLVKNEIDKNTVCNIVKVRPVALSALCVLSLAALPGQT